MGKAPAKPAPAAKAAPAAVAPVVEPVKEEKKKEKKSQKERPKSKKKHTKVQIWKLYDKTGKRKNEHCPRCGAGTFLAQYKNRKYCGKCGWAQVQTA